MVLLPPLLVGSDSGGCLLKDVRWGCFLNKTAREKKTKDDFFGLNLV